MERLLLENMFGDDQPPIEWGNVFSANGHYGVPDPAGQRHDDTHLELHGDPEGLLRAAQAIEDRPLLEVLSIVTPRTPRQIFLQPPTLVRQRLQDTDALVHAITHQPTLIRLSVSINSNHVDWLYCMARVLMGAPLLRRLEMYGVDEGMMDPEGVDARTTFVMALSQNTSVEFLECSLGLVDPADTIVADLVNSNRTLTMLLAEGLRGEYDVMLARNRALTSQAGSLQLAVAFHLARRCGADLPSTHYQLNRPNMNLLTQAYLHLLEWRGQYNLYHTAFPAVVF